MSYVKQLLGRDEEIALVAHDHWITLLLTVLVDAAVSVVIIGVSVLGIIISPPWTWFGLLLLLAPIGHTLLRLWKWWNKQYVITNRRIIQITGTFSKRVSDTLLEKINDIVMEQSGLGRMLKFGDIQIISGSESGIDVFHLIADPVGFKKELLDQKTSAGRPDVAEEPTEEQQDLEASSANDAPELIAELDKLRQKGLLSDAEFEEKKRQLLDRM